MPAALQWAVDMGVGSADICLPRVGKTSLTRLVMSCTDEFCAFLLASAQDAGISSDEADLVVNAQAFIAGMTGRLRQYELAGIVRLTENGGAAK